MSFHQLYTINLYTTIWVFHIFCRVCKQWDAYHSQEKTYWRKTILLWMWQEIHSERCSRRSPEKMQAYKIWWTTYVPFFIGCFVMLIVAMSLNMFIQFDNSIYLRLKFELSVPHLSSGKQCVIYHYRVISRASYPLRSGCHW